jgi:hypothetical protein
MVEPGEEIMDEILRVGSDDILYRLRKEERERYQTIKLWEANARYGSIREDDHIHRLTKEAADEITRLRTLLAESGAAAKL